MADTSTTGNSGTEVTLVVTGSTTVVSNPPTAPRPPLAHTGFELVTALLLTALLLALGSALLVMGRRPASHLPLRRTQ